MAAEAPPPRFETARLVAGRGTYTADIVLPHIAHVAFLRSPHAHARIHSINVETAKGMPGVVFVATAADLAGVCAPMHTVMENAPDHVSPPQHPLASEVARWQGEPVAAVVAETRAAAEDAIEAITVEWEPLPAVTDAIVAFDGSAALVHPRLGHNRALDRVLGSGDIAAPLASGEVLVEHRFAFNRHTGVPLEPRAIVVDYEPIEGRMTIYQSTQVPHQTRDVFARLLSIPEHRIRVICRDVGGGFGLKLHIYPDELATAALAKLLGRPVRYEARRAESFLSDAHTREFYVRARLAANADGTLVAIDADLLCGAGAYSIYPRGSIGDAFLASVVLGGAYRLKAARAHARVAYLNKVPSGSYRGVGHPIGCTVTEVLVDEAAYALKIDPVEYRRRSYYARDSLPTTTPTGLVIENHSLASCLEALVTRMDYASLRAEQARLRAHGRILGIGVASFIEMTAPGSRTYGAAGIRISAQDTAMVKLDPSGFVHCAVGCTDQGQGTLTGVAQLVARVMGVPLTNVVVEAGDTAGPHGGGAWASRGLSISGEAAHHAAVTLRARILELAGTLLQTEAQQLTIRDSTIVNSADGMPRMTLAELSAIAHYRQYTLPGGVAPPLVAQESFVPSAPFYLANGVQGCLLEIDRETGLTTLLKHWVADDCGVIVNEALVEGQLHGGIAQGVGAALFEHCFYEPGGQLLAGSLLDYAIPRAGDLPNIDVDHVSTPQQGTAIGVKGVGEAGTVGASAAVWCALNDALRPFGARVERMPFTAPSVLAALRRS